MRLEDIVAGSSLTGVETSQVVTTVASVPLADGVVQLIYRTPQGEIKERMLRRADEAAISVATKERPFSCDCTRAAFQPT